MAFEHPKFESTLFQLLLCDHLKIANDDDKLLAYPLPQIKCELIDPAINGPPNCAFKILNLLGTCERASVFFRPDENEDFLYRIPFPKSEIEAPHFVRFDLIALNMNDNVVLCNLENVTETELNEEEKTVYLSSMMENLSVNEKVLSSSDNLNEATSIDHLTPLDDDEPLMMDDLAPLDDYEDDDPVYTIPD